MQAPDPRDKQQMLSLYLILGAMTLALAFLFKLVLFSPVPALVEMATK